MRDRLGLVWEVFLAGVYLSALVVIVLSLALGVWVAINRAMPGR